MIVRPVGGVSNMGDGLSNLNKGVISVGALAAVVLVSIAIIQGFSDTGLVDVATADKFKTGMQIFATFVGVVVLAIVGKTVIGLFNGGGDGSPRKRRKTTYAPTRYDDKDDY